MEDEIIPNVTEWDEAKKVPDSVYKAMGEKGYLAGLMGQRTWPSHLTKSRIASVDPKDYDAFHELVLTDELSRAGSGGFVWNVIGGFGIGAPPLVRFGRPEVVQRVMPQILSGDKRICLAITEPDAGSDVANITCEAKLTEDGKHYIVNGEKKWITNGIWYVRIVPHSVLVHRNRMQRREVHSSACFSTSPMDTSEHAKAV